MKNYLQKLSDEISSRNICIENLKLKINAQETEFNEKYNELGQEKSQTLSKFQSEVLKLKETFEQEFSKECEKHRKELVELEKNLASAKNLFDQKLINMEINKNQVYIL